MNTVILSTSMVKHCDHCGKDGHEKKDCHKWERGRKEQSERDEAKNLERVANETTEKEKGQQRSQRKGGEDVRKKFPCVLFMKQGKCSYGDKCAYSHDTELAKSFKENDGGKVNSIHFSWDGLGLITSSEDDQIIIYDCERG